MCLRLNKKEYRAPKTGEVTSSASQEKCDLIKEILIRKQRVLKENKRILKSPKLTITGIQQTNGNNLRFTKKTQYLIMLALNGESLNSLFKSQNRIIELI